MGMSPTATLTYGYNIKPSIDWDADEPDEHARRLLQEAGDFPDNINVHWDYEGENMRLIGAFLQASGWRDQGKTDSLELPEGTDDHLRRAAEVLGIVLVDAKPGWLLTAEFN